MTWPIVPLQELAAPFKGSITDGPFGSNLARQHYRDSGPRVVRLQNIGDGVFIDSPAHIDQSHFEALRKHEVLEGDLLIASLGEVLPRACLMPSGQGHAIVKADCIRVRLRDDVDPRWVNYSLQRPAARKWAEQHRHGVGRPRLGLKGIREIPTPLPSLEEQRRIVEIVEDHLSRLDAVSVSLTDARTRSESMLISHLSSVVGRHRHLGDPSAPIGELANTALGKMLDSKRSSGVPTPYLANINVRWGRFVLENLKRVPLTDDEQQRLRLEPGDVVVCEGGEPGRCAVWELEDSGIAYQKALHRIRVKDLTRVTPGFLALMVREAVQSGRAERLFTGSTIKHLPQEKLRQIEIPLPRIAEQRAVVAKANEVVNATERLEDNLSVVTRRGQQLRRAVLAAAFEGKLTGRHTDAEIIEELTDV